MPSTITYIQEPSYEVDFRQFASHRDDFAKPEHRYVGAAAFGAIKAFGSSLGTASYITLSNAGVSFKHIVLGYHGSLAEFSPPADIYLAVFKVAYWVVSMGLCCTTTTFRLFDQKLNGHKADDSVKTFSSDALNPDHIKCDEVALDTSGVPEEVQVDDLATIFDKINFSDASAPGYMAPSSRQEYSTIYTIEALKKSLTDEFIHNIKTRTAFIGTPPSYDTPRLMAFYQQVEDAVRLSIHKLNENMKAFQAVSGTDIAEYNEEEMRTYKGLLEDRARVAIDFAIAGKRCGARFMGDAMDTYYNLYGDSSNDNATLSGYLQELLANKRREVARQQIATHMGHDTHYFTQYFANLGQILGIPGTKNIVETLSGPLNLPKYLKLFFQEYTVDYIIDAVQNEVKTSQKFREKLVDWLRDQVQDWKKAQVSREAEQIAVRIQDILQAGPSQECREVRDFKDFQALIVYLKANKADLDLNDLMKNGWSDFLEEVFYLNETDTWLEQGFPDLDNFALSDKRRDLKESCSQAKLGEPLLQALQAEVLGGAQVEAQLLQDRFALTGKLAKIGKIPGVMGLNKEVLQRAIEKGDAELKSILENHLDQHRGKEFLDALNLEEMVSDGLTPQMIEWLLVSQGIFLPQVKQFQEDSLFTEASLAALAPEKAAHRIAYLQTMVEPLSRESPRIYTWLEGSIIYGGLSTEATELAANEILQTLGTSHQASHSAKRYHFKAPTARDELLNHIFNRSFAEPASLAAAAQLTSDRKPLYSTWKKVVYIDLPKCVNCVASDFVVKVAVSVAAAVFMLWAGIKGYDATTHFVAEKLVPFVINNASLHAIHAYNAVLDIKDWTYDHLIEIFIGAWVTKQVLTRGPRVPYLTALAEKINLWTVFEAVTNSPQTVFLFFIDAVIDAASFGWKTCNHIGQAFETIARRGELDRLTVCREKQLPLWAAATMA